MLGDQLARLAKFRSTQPSSPGRTMTDEELYFLVLPLQPTRPSEFTTRFNETLAGYLRFKSFKDSEYSFLIKIVEKQKRHSALCEKLLTALENGQMKGEEGYFLSLLGFYEERGYFSPAQIDSIEKKNL